MAEKHPQICSEMLQCAWYAAHTYAHRHTDIHAHTASSVGSDTAANARQQLYLPVAALVLETTCKQAPHIPALNPRAQSKRVTCVQSQSGCLACGADAQTRRDMERETSQILATCA